MSLSSRLFSRTLLLCLLALAIFPDSARTQTPPPAAFPGLGPVTASKLPNGLQVLVAPSQAADLVAIDVWVDAGTRREIEANNGAAHFLEHLLFKGTPTRKPGEIDAAIENLGGTLNAATSYDWAHFYVTVGASDAEAALLVVADALKNAQIRPSDMDAERPVILNEMARADNSPTARLARAFNALYFGSHPYGRPIMGTEASVTQMTRQTVADFYQKYYAPGGVTLVLAGSLTPEAGAAMAKKAFGDWPARAIPIEKTRAQTTPAQIRSARLTLAVPRGYLMLGFPAPSVKDKPDAWVMDVLLTRLGQGGNNRLEQTLVRERKLAQSVDASFLTQHDAGALTLQAAFEAGRETQIREAMLAEIAALRDTPLSEGELDAAKHALLASYLFTAQTGSGRADALGFYSTIDTYQYDTDYISHFESVTSAQIQSLARKYLNPAAYTLVEILPRVDPTFASRRP